MHFSAQATARRAADIKDPIRHLDAHCIKKPKKAGLQLSQPI
jgi:hypothetical protein